MECYGGKSMVACSISERYDYYGCGPRAGVDVAHHFLVPAGSLEEKIWADAQAILTRPVLKALEEEAQRGGTILQERIPETGATISSLDLAETAGSQAARARLVERETEKTRLVAELRVLQEQRKHGQVDISPEVLSAALAQMRETLFAGDTKSKRIVLKQFVQKIVIEGHKGTLYYTFPLHVRAYVLVPPAEFESALPP